MAKLKWWGEGSGGDVSEEKGRFVIKKTTTDGRFALHDGDEKVMTGALRVCQKEAQRRANSKKKDKTNPDKPKESPKPVKQQVEPKGVEPIVEDPDSTLTWEGPIETNGSLDHYWKWTTTCKRYQVTRAKEHDQTVFFCAFIANPKTGSFDSSVKHEQGLGVGHPRRYDLLTSAFMIAEQFHCQKTKRESVTSNASQVVEAAAAQGLATGKTKLRKISEVRSLSGDPAFSRSEKVKRVKPVGETKKRGERGQGEDRFGNRIGSQASSINSAVEAGNLTVEAVSQVTELSKTRVSGHFVWLITHKFAEQDGKGKIKLIG